MFKICKRSTKLKEDLIVADTNGFGRTSYFIKRATQKQILDGDFETYQIAKGLKCVKNAVGIWIDDLFVCKHYDTIIFEYHKLSHKILTLYWDCSQTSNRMIYQCLDYLSLPQTSKFITKNTTKQEDSPRNNNFSHPLGDAYQ